MTGVSDKRGVPRQVQYKFGGKMPKGQKRQWRESRPKAVFGLFLMLRRIFFKFDFIYIDKYIILIFKRR